MCSPDLGREEGGRRRLGSLALLRQECSLVWQREITAEHRAAAIPAAAPVAAPAPAPAPAPAAAAPLAAPADPASAPWFALDDLSLACPCPITLLQPILPFLRFSWEQEPEASSLSPPVSPDQCRANLTAPPNEAARTRCEYRPLRQAGSSGIADFP